MILNSILCLPFLILVTSAENVELTELLPSIFTEEGGNVLREAIDLLQLEKIEQLKNQNEEAENKILDLEKEIQKLKEDHKKLKEDHKTEIQKTVQVNAVRMKTIQKDVEKLKEQHKEILQEKEDAFMKEAHSFMKEAQNMKAEIKLLNQNIKSQEIIVNFVFGVLRKGENMMRSKQNVIEAQSVYIEEKEAMLGQYKALQETVSKQKEVIETQSSKISELEKTISSNEQLKVAYEKISKSVVENNNCNDSDLVTSMTEGLTSQKENIDHLTSSMQHNDKLESICKDLRESFSNLVWETNGNFSLISHYQTLLQNQSETITMLQGMVTGIRYQEENGLVVSGSPCECLPLPPTTGSLGVTNVKLDCAEGSILSYNVRCADGKCDTEAWPECSTRETKEEIENEKNIRWVYSNCSATNIPYLYTRIDCGAAGHKTPLLKEYLDSRDIDDDNEIIDCGYHYDDCDIDVDEAGKTDFLKDLDQGALRREYIFPCLDCAMFEWSAWSTSSPGRLSRVRGDNTIVEGSYQEAVKDEDGDVSLMGGNGNSTGNVYVTNKEGYHGPVCDDQFWNNNAATVVCKELGFTGGIAKRKSYFGNVDDLFAIDDVYCSGSETSILQCDYRTYYYNAYADCGPREGAGVVCY